MRSPSDRASAPAGSAAGAGQVLEHVETEWQFDAPDLRPVQRWVRAHVASGDSGAGPSIKPQPTRRLVDVYLDTTDWRIYRAGYSLRLRRVGSASEATLKALAPASAGPRRRREVTELLPGDGLDPFQRSRGPVGGRVRLLSGSRPIQPILEVWTRRTPFRLQLGQVHVGELALDETTVAAGDDQKKRARLLRVEVEVGEAHVPALMTFVDTLRAETRLQPALLSKFEFGLLVAGIEPEASPSLGPTQVLPSLTVGEVAFAILRRNFAVFLAKEPGTRLGEDVEELHDMRVASRRLRAALALFANVLPIRAMPFREELGLVAAALGAVRDLDVEIAKIGSWIELAEEPDRGPLGTLAKLLEDERNGAREVLLSTLDSKRYERLVQRFSALLDRGPLRASPGSRMPAHEAAPELILSRFRKVREAAQRLDARSDPNAYHRLRVRCKRLRYALEFFDDVYAGGTRAIAEDLAELQDILGLHQDAYVAIARLRSMAASLGEEIGPSAAFAMGEVAERYRRGARRQRNRFPKAYRRFHGKRWRNFERLMERERTASLRSHPSRPRQSVPRA